METNQRQIFSMKISSLLTCISGHHQVEPKDFKIIYILRLFILSRGYAHCLQVDLYLARPPLISTYRTRVVDFGRQSIGGRASYDS